MFEADPPDGPIAGCFRQVPVLKAVLDELDALTIAALERDVVWHGLSGGSTLFEQGGSGQDLFVLLHGRLAVLVDSGLGRRLVHHVEPGEMVGEMAMISSEKRTATLVALRDSEVLRIPAETARMLLAQSHALTTAFLGQLVDRLRATTAGDNKSVGIEVVAIVPLDDGLLDEHELAPIAAGFEALRGGAVIVHATSGDSGDAADQPRRLHAMIAPRRGTLWARRIIRQADRVLFIARAGGAPDAQAADIMRELAHQNRPADLMLLNPLGTLRPTGAAAWFAHFAPDQIFHVTAGSAADHARVARMVTGTAVGVALAGGGARGFAHIGALRALVEAGVPIDMVCGTSMGALIGGSYAIDLDLEEVTRKVHHSFVLNRPIGDYTVPVFALSRGRRMSGLLQHHFADVRIEDCWRTFFCVSANLTTGAAQIHRDGLLWRAMRASSSLPGIVPPLIEGNDILVDGGLMNNFPVDVMAAMARGRVIGIDVSAGTVCRAEIDDIESRSIAWMLRRGRHLVPNIFKLLMRSGLVASGVHAAANAKAADLLIQPELGTVDLLSFDRYAEAIEMGYNSTLKAIAAQPQPFS